MAKRKTASRRKAAAKAKRTTTRKAAAKSRQKTEKMAARKTSPGRAKPKAGAGRKRRKAG